MNSPLKKIKFSQYLQSELSKCQLVNTLLKPQMLSLFKQLIQQIFKTINWKAEVFLRQNAQKAEARLTQILTILKQSNSQITLCYLMKKIAFIFMFLNNCSFHKIIDQGLSTFLQSQIMKLIDQINKMSNKKQERASNFTKMCGFIRSISFSEDKKESSKLKLEQLDDKAVIKEMLKNCLEPYCHYMLKILQDNQVYISIIRKESENNQECIEWKIMNWTTRLCDIVLKTNRLAKYFKHQLLGVWVFMYYIISIDFAVFKDTLTFAVQRQIKHWIQKIINIQKLSKISQEHMIQESQLVLKNPKFIELRREIQQLDKIRQQLHYLYNNDKIKDWRLEFIFPQKQKNRGKDKKQNKEEHIKQFIQIFQIKIRKASGQPYSPNIINVKLQQKKRRQSQINSRNKIEIMNPEPTYDISSLMQLVTQQTRINHNLNQWERKLQDLNLQNISLTKWNSADEDKRIII